MKQENQFTPGLNIFISFSKLLSDKINSRHGNEEQLVTLFGVMQALVSVIEDGEDSMETIFAGDTTFVFLHKSPLILVAVSKLRDSVFQLQNQLQ